MIINGAHSTSTTGGNGVEMSVLERQRSVFKWQQDHLENSQQEQQTYFNDFSMLSLQQTHQNFQQQTYFHDGGLNELLTARPIKPDPGLESGSGWHDGISRTASCPPEAANESFRKRKAGPPKAETENETRAKKIKGSFEEDALTTTAKNSNSSKNCDKERKRKEDCEAQKSDYIHVRARRGQATDSHSLAERVRREKISERMKYLQDLVPGCNKITGKAGMLDEIINYVQSLQRQVEFLSMKLAAVSPTLDFNIEDLFSKEVFEACSSNFHRSEITSDMTNLAYLSVSDLGMSEVEMGLQRSISAPVSIPDTYLDSSCLTQQTQTNLPWDQSYVHTMYSMDFQQARQQSYPSQTDTGAN